MGLEWNPLLFGSKWIGEEFRVRHRPRSPQQWGLGFPTHSRINYSSGVVPGGYFTGMSQFMNSIDSHHRRLDYRLLWIVCLLTFAFRVVTLLRWGNNYLWPDEVYQSLEQAHRAIFWLWNRTLGISRCRKVLGLPRRAGGADAIGAPLGRGGYLFVPRLALSLLSVTPVAITFLWTRRSTGRVAAVVAALCVGVWFELVTSRQRRWGRLWPRTYWSWAYTY